MSRTDCKRAITRYLNTFENEFADLFDPPLTPEEMIPLRDPKKWKRIRKWTEENTIHRSFRCRIARERAMEDGSVIRVEVSEGGGPDEQYVRDIGRNYYINDDE